MINMNELNNRLDSYLDGFLQSWKAYTEYYLSRVKDKAEDYEACNVV